MNAYKAIANFEAEYVEFSLNSSVFKILVMFVWS